MQAQYVKDFYSEKGQITVFLSLLLLALFSFLFCVINGVQRYCVSYLGEDAVKNAGENILTNYDRELFKRYHIFFLDPRERKYILSDGKNFINDTFTNDSFFKGICKSLDITEEKTAVDEDGMYLKHEIREWMKYREIEKVEKQIKDLTKRMESVASIGKEQNQLESLSEETERLDEENVEETDPEVLKIQTNWKEIKETLQLLMKTGILFYVIDSPEKISRQSLVGRDLPSQIIHIKGEDNPWDRINNLSFSNLKEIKSLLSTDVSIDKGSLLWSREMYLISYIEECFSCYGTIPKEEERAIFYETEYLITGGYSDLNNLKRIANDILLLRFISNYMFTGANADMKVKVDTMASAVTGVIGMPQATKAVEVIIRAALSYGESLLELHTLFSGGQIPLIKNKENWNIQLETMVKQLKEKRMVKTGKKNISYKDFLKVFLLMKGESKELCYRMMDVMQENIACKEEGFLMKDCLFSYKWRGTLSFGAMQLEVNRQNTY